MSTVSIGGIWTMNPGDVWTPVKSFSWNDPFGILMEINYSADLVAEGIFVDILWQLVNPRDDADDPQVWWRVIADEPDIITTVDYAWKQAPVPATDLGYYLMWNKYGDALEHIGAAGFGGVFAVRGQVTVRGTDFFDLTDPYAFKYTLRADWA